MDVRKRIYENAKTLAKIKGIKLSEIEKQIGISSGYLSRKSKGLTIEKVYKLANVLDVTLAELTEHDYMEDYKKWFTEDELKDVVHKALEVMDGFDILQIVNDAIKGR